MNYEPLHDRLHAQYLILGKNYSQMHLRPFEVYCEYCSSPPVTPVMPTARTRETEVLQREHLFFIPHHPKDRREGADYERHVTDSRCLHTKLRDAEIMAFADED